MASYHIGCSGYYYSYWKGKFYPKEIAPKNWLTYYSSIFNTVELNGTFYRVPKLAALKRYHEITPENFTFSVKMSKHITHILRLKNTEKEVADFQDLIMSGLENKLSHFLFQLPPSFHYSEENLHRILTAIPREPHNVVEFRHVSWWNPQVMLILRGAGITFCNVDFPGLHTPIQGTTDLFYMRLHGNPVLFKSIYTLETLENIFQSFPTDLDSYNVYFNNTYFEAGYTNALQLMDIIKSQPGFKLPAISQEIFQH